MKFTGELEVDLDRGVVYFHDASTGTTKLRICKLGKIPDSFSMIDVTNGFGVAIYRDGMKEHEPS